MTEKTNGDDANDRLDALVWFWAVIQRPNTEGPWISKDKPTRKPRWFCPKCKGWGDRTIFRVKCKECGGSGFKPNDMVSGAEC